MGSPRDPWNALVALAYAAVATGYALLAAEDRVAAIGAAGYALLAVGEGAHAPRVIDAARATLALFACLLLARGELAAAAGAFGQYFMLAGFTALGAACLAVYYASRLEGHAANLASAASATPPIADALLLGGQLVLGAAYVREAARGPAPPPPAPPH